MKLEDQHLRTILVSGDPDFIRTACGRIESAPGLIIVATADSGFATQIAVDVLHPELVLIDVATPGMDGVEATRRIKARPKAPAVVWITPHDPADIAGTARDSGADGVISKRELGDSVDCILRALDPQRSRG